MIQWSNCRRSGDFFCCNAWKIEGLTPGHSFSAFFFEEPRSGHGLIEACDANNREFIVMQQVYLKSYLPTGITTGLSDGDIVTGYTLDSGCSVFGSNATQHESRNMVTYSATFHSGLRRESKSV